MGEMAVEMFFLFLFGLLIGGLVVWYYLDSKQQARIDEVQASWESKVKHYEQDIKNADTAHEETKARLRDLQSEHQRCGHRVSDLETRLNDARSASARASRVEALTKQELDRTAGQSLSDDRTLREAQSRILELEARLRAQEHAKLDTPLIATPAQTAGSAADPGRTATSRRVSALDAKIRQLPAGSSARRKLEAERSQLLGTGTAVKTDSVEPVQGGNSDLEPLFVTPTGAADDLKIIKGIGPVLEKKVNKLGITTFAQVAALGSNDIEKIDAVLDFKGRIEREKWVEQAQALIDR